VMPNDTGAQAFMHNTTFLVDGFEVYNHDRKTSNELTLTCDSIYITFAENNMFITKVLFNANDPEQTYYDYSTMEAHYGNGAFMGVWSNPYTFLDAVGFSWIRTIWCRLYFRGVHEPIHSHDCNG